MSEGAITVLFEKVKDTAKKCVMNDYERRYPTHCADIAIVIRQLADRRLQVLYDTTNINDLLDCNGHILTLKIKTLCFD